jgi:mono/diheme cytochrome c family protein
VNGIPGFPLRLGLTAALLALPGVAQTANPVTNPVTNTAEPPRPAMVAGFERFARHGDLESAEAGRLLLGELSCTACHSSTRPGSLEPRRGPRLEAVGIRLQAVWLARHLDNPSATDPGTTMPDLLHAIPPNRKTRTIAALLAFLSTQREGYPELKSTASRPVAGRFFDKGDPGRGRLLFHQIGCVACHQPDPTFKARPQPASELTKLLTQLDPEELKELGLETAARPFPSIPHGQPASKYTREALAHFLLQPETTRPAGRMPSLKLEPHEAANLAAYLHPANTPANTLPHSNDTKLIQTGRRMFQSLGCNRCHTVNSRFPPAEMPITPLNRLRPAAVQSCLANPTPAQPRYQLDPQQRKAITAGILSIQSATPTTLPSPALALHRTLLTLNCYACHTRGQTGGVGPGRRAYFETAGHADLGDEGRLPPTLTGAGNKLKTVWMQKVFEGTGDVRPHLEARMPVFPVREVLQLPRQLAAVDRGTDSPPSKVFGDFPPLATAGRTLVDRGCVQCHPVRSERLPGVVGVDLAGATSRIRPDWMRRFLLDPASQKKRTRMPTFFPKGKTNSPDVLDGNVDRQLASLWAYMADIERQPLPEKIIRDKVDNYELVPGERPLILRTFMQRAGRHAIAVGFPSGTHFAFNARTGSAVEAWRGRFLDAHATWFNRFIPPAAPLGNQLISLPDGLALNQLNSADSPWPAATDPATAYRFGGYRLDKSRVPTLLYSLGTLQVQDRIEPTAGHGLKRTLTITNQATTKPGLPTAWIRGLTGQALASPAPGAYTNEHGLTVSVRTKRSHADKMMTIGGRSEWRIPIVIAPRAVVEIHYRW